MALNDFKGSIWSAAIQASLDNALVAGALVMAGWADEQLGLIEPGDLND